MTDLQIHPDLADLCPPLTTDERDYLEQSLRAEGCRDPIVVWKGRGVILDGHNRYLVCHAHQIPFTTIEVACADLDDAKAWVIRNQLGRRNLPPYAKVELVLALKSLIAARAKSQQGARTDLSPTLAECFEPLDTRDALADAAGVSHGTIDKGQFIAEHAPEELKAKLRSGDETIHGVYTKLRSHEKIADLRDKARATQPPKGTFNVIVIDPPWPYQARADDVSHRARNPYPSMTIAELEAFSIPAADDCILFCWATNAFLKDAFALVERWGFESKTVLTWAKDRMGLGNWLRGQTEHCILAVRGKPVVELTYQTTLLEAPVREHSRKPDEFYELVESLCPYPARIDMFARESRPGWATWGNEVGEGVAVS